MTTIDPARPEPAPMSLPARVLGTLTSPAETFRSVAAHPRWLGVLLLTTLVPAVLWFVLLSTERGQTAMLDQQVEQTEAWGQTVSDEMYANMERGIGFTRIIVAASTMVFGPLMTVLLAGLLYGIFNLALGGAATFRQVFSVVVHAGVVMLLQPIFTVPINYARESMASASNLLIFVPMLDERGVAGRFLSIIDLFIIWWAVVLAIGLGVLYRRQTTPIFSALMAVYVGFALVIALVMRAFGGS